MKKYVVDFESYYSKAEGVSASLQGVQNYVFDNNSYAYMVSIVGPGVKWCGSIEEAVKKFPGSFMRDPENEFWAANSNFDYEWACRYWGNTLPEWKCVLDEGASEQLPQHLAGVCQVLFHKKIDKSIRDRMNNRHFAELTDEEKLELHNYCLNDSVEEAAVLETITGLSDFESKVAAQTRRINRKGVRIDTALVESNLDALQKFKHEQHLAIPWVREGGAPLSHPQLKTWCLKEGLPCPVSTAKTDERCTQLMAEYPALGNVLTSMRSFRRSNTLIEKIKSLQKRITPSGKLPLELLYCGARHTRRWSSRGFNVQNLDRNPWKIEVAGEEVPIWSRSWIIPDPGKIFLILDYSQIEPRCLNYIAGNTAMLDLVRAGFSVYEAYARSIGIWKGDETLKYSDPDLYKIVKAEVLGLGYGMGVATHAHTTGQPMDVAEMQVKRFREKNPMIKGLWKSLDSVVKKALMDGSKTVELQMDTGDWLRHFHVRNQIGKKDGRFYSSTESYTIRGDFGHNSHQPRLWGGTLTENITQRAARDILANGMLLLEDAGFDIMFSAHDEVILQVDDDKTKEDAKVEAERLLSTAPPWWPTIPLEVEGDFAERYTKI